MKYRTQNHNTNTQFSYGSRLPRSKLLVLHLQTRGLHLQAPTPLKRFSSQTALAKLLSSPLLSSHLSSFPDHDKSADMSGAIFGLSGDRAVKAVLRGQESVSQSVRASVRPSVRPSVSQSVSEPVVWNSPENS